MRMRLGLLQDPAVIERQVRREQEEIERKRNPEVTATAKTKEETEAEQKEKEDIRKRLKGSRRRVKPLSESKAIDSGATFISESFLFLVAGGLILWESWRRDNKEGKRRDEVQARLDKLEGDLQGLRTENQTLKHDVGRVERIDGALGAPITYEHGPKRTPDQTMQAQSTSSPSDSRTQPESHVAGATSGPGDDA